MILPIDCKCYKMLWDPKNHLWEQVKEADWIWIIFTVQCDLTISSSSLKNNYRLFDEELHQ